MDRKNTLCAMTVYLKLCVDLFCKEWPYIVPTGIFFKVKGVAVYIYA